DKARFVASIPGVLLVPEKPTTAVQLVMGCVHDRDGITRREVPIRLDTIPNKGTATCAGVAPAPCAARSTHLWQGTDRVSTGNSVRLPRRESRKDQWGSFQLWSESYTSWRFLFRPACSVPVDPVS